MINCRWTSLEITKALSPFPQITQQQQRQQSQRQQHQQQHNIQHGTTTQATRTNTHGEGEQHDHHHVLIKILLYGEGYERVANEAASRSSTTTMKSMMTLNDDGRRHRMEGVTTAVVTRSHYVVAMPLPKFNEQYYRTTDIIRGVGSPGKSLPSLPSLPTPPQSSSIRSPSSPLLDNDINVSKADAILLFTSGTTSTSGIAKGVRLSHVSLYIQLHAKTLPPCKYDKHTCLLANAVPWFHVGGINSALGVMMAGGCLMFPPPPSLPPQPLPTAADGAPSQQQRIGSGFRPDLVLQSLSVRDALPSLTMSPSIASSSSLWPASSSTSCITANTLVVVPAMLHAIIAECSNNNNWQNHNNTPKASS